MVILMQTTKFVQVEVDVPLQNWFNSALVNLWLCGPQNISQSSGNRCSSVLVQVSLGSSALVQVSPVHWCKYL